MIKQGYKIIHYTLTRVSPTPSMPPSPSVPPQDPLLCNRTVLDRMTLAGWSRRTTGNQGAEDGVEGVRAGSWGGGQNPTAEVHTL